LIIFCIFDVTVLNAQVSRSGEPVSWDLLEDLTENLNIISFENIDANALLAEDVIETEDKDIPLRFAQKQVVDLNLVNSGRWTNLPNGDRIWILGIHSEGAKALSVTFDVFLTERKCPLPLLTRSNSSYWGIDKREQQRFRTAHHLCHYGRRFAN